jgi:hypothetical protein
MAATLANRSAWSRKHVGKRGEAEADRQRRATYRPAMTARRFPAPWTVEEYRGIPYIVRDANRFAVAYVYFESQPGRRAAATS